MPIARLESSVAWMNPITPSRAAEGWNAVSSGRARADLPGTRSVSVHHAATDGADDPDQRVDMPDRTDEDDRPTDELDGRAACLVR